MKIAQFNILYVVQTIFITWETLNDSRRAKGCMFFFAIIFILIEIIQLFIKRKAYLMEIFNWIELIGNIMVICYFANLELA